MVTLKRWSTKKERSGHIHPWGLKGGSSCGIGGGNGEPGENHQACLVGLAMPRKQPEHFKKSLFFKSRCMLIEAPGAGQMQNYHAGQNVYLPVFCFEGLISEFPKFTYRIPSLRASFSSQVKKCRKPVLFLGCRFSVR